MKFYPLYFNFPSDSSFSKPTAFNKIIGPTSCDNFDLNAALSILMDLYLNRTRKRQRKRTTKKATTEEMQ
jgi:hypothetical protein